MMSTRNKKVERISIKSLSASVRVIEQETIANMKIGEGIATVSLNAVNKLSDAFLAGNKILRKRLKQNADTVTFAGYGVVVAYIRRVLGIDALERRTHDDFRLIIEMFSKIGGKESRITPDDVGVVLSIMAMQLDKQSEGLDKQDKEDLKSAATSVRRMADRFLIGKDTIKGE